MLQPERQEQLQAAADEFKLECARLGYLNDQGQLHLPQVLENIHILRKGWFFVSCAAADMPSGYLGLVEPADQVLRLREDVYEGLCRGHPEHIFTAAHEIGHMVLHSELALARVESCRDPASLRQQTEEEADRFAHMLLQHDPAVLLSACQVAQDLMRRIATTEPGGQMPLF